MESNNDKSQVTVTAGNGVPVQQGHISSKWMGTATDQLDMSILGRVQVVRRNFNFVPIVGFSCSLIATWEIILSLLSQGLMDGGIAGLIWGFVVVAVGFFLVFTSLAEMASMAPTSGGQYHWVSEFAPRNCQKFLSYMTGWLCATGWQCGVVAVAFIAGTIIQGLIVLNDATYVYARWQGTLLIIAITTFSVLFNTFLAKKLPLIETLLLILHVVGLFLVIIPLWVVTPLNSAESVFTNFGNAGGWNSYGTATIVGFSTSIAGLSGYDCAVHMSEETRDASRTLPRAMITAFLLDSVLGFLLLVTIGFTIGDINDALSSPTGYPFIQIFYNSTKNLRATNALTSILIMTMTASTITDLAAASRQLWSFARDRGVPFSDFFAYVTPGWNIPLNSVLGSLAITILLSLINIGSTVALNAIVSLTIAALVSSYIVSISCLLLKRLRGEPLPPRRWTLGRWGMAINIAALCFLLPLFVFAFFPLTSTVDAPTMNWSIVMFAGVIIFSTVYYALVGRHYYTPPVNFVKRTL